MKLFKSLCAVVLSISLLVGCGSLTGSIDNDKLLTQVAVMKVIEAGKTADGIAERKAKILAVAAEAHKWLDFEGVVLADLEGKLKARVAELDLLPSDRLVANILVEAVIKSLKDRVVDGVKLPEASDDLKLRVNTVLGWVEDTAKYY